MPEVEALSASLRHRTHCCQPGEAVDTKPADALDDDDRAERLEHEADQRYADAKRETAWTDKDRSG
jgi:hypothetical protein